MDKAIFLPKVIEYDRYQPEFYEDTKTYVGKRSNKKKVVKGKGIGKSIGWPTANLEIDGRKFLPGEGVYASWTTIENSNKKIESVMNLGSQPTINPLSPSAVEVHLINKIP